MDVTLFLTRKEGRGLRLNLLVASRRAAWTGPQADELWYFVISKYWRDKILGNKVAASHPSGGPAKDETFEQPQETSAADAQWEPSTDSPRSHRMVCGLAGVDPQLQGPSLARSDDSGPAWRVRPGSALCFIPNSP